MCIIKWTKYLDADQYTVFFWILLESSIIQFINIRCNSKTKKQLFIIFEVLGVLAILGNFAFGVMAINNLSNRYDRYTESWSHGPLVPK